MEINFAEATTSTTISDEGGNRSSGNNHRCDFAHCARRVPNNGKGRPGSRQKPSGKSRWCHCWLPAASLLLAGLLLLLPSMAADGPSSSHLQRLISGSQPASTKSLPSQQKSPSSYASAIAHNRRMPFNVLLILPERESNNDKFGLTVSKVRPVIDIAIEDVIKHGTMPPGWINITYHDSRYWEDILLAERVSATGVVQAYCEKRLDAILGFADAYSLATVSKISAGFGDGVPVLTTTGLTTLIGYKKSYPYVTRMRGSYTQISEAAYEFVATHDQDDSIPHRGINLNYRNVVFMYHDKRRALNKPPSGSRRGESEESPSSSCYFSLHAIKSYFQEHNQAVFMEAWKSQTPNVAFDEELAHTKAEVAEWVQMASMHGNGEFIIFYHLWWHLGGREKIAKIAKINASKAAKNGLRKSLQSPCIFKFQT